MEFGDFSTVPERRVALITGITGQVKLKLCIV